MQAVNGVHHKTPEIKKHPISKRFVVKTKRREHIVIDKTTGLMWQQVASSRQMIYELAIVWINRLNESRFAGFSDWRLPTLAEAMTLMEQIPNDHGLYIDPVFDAKKRAWMWTSDRGGENSAWYVNFNYGYSHLNRIGSGTNYARAVRQNS